jgi:hypothetical protein
MNAVSDLHLAVIANRIALHLRSFERNPKINHIDKASRTARFFWASAWSTGRRVCVTYVSYQGPTKLTRAEAAAYLAWLDAGNVGTHFEALREAKP